MKTKIYLLAASLIVLMFVFGLTACGGGGGSAPAGTYTDDSTTETTETTNPRANLYPLAVTSGAWLYEDDGSLGVDGFIIISPNFNYDPEKDVVGDLSQTGTFLIYGLADEIMVINFFEGKTQNDNTVDGVLYEYYAGGKYIKEYNPVTLTVNDNTLTIGGFVFTRIDGFDKPTSIDSVVGTWVDSDSGVTYIIDADGNISDGEGLCSVEILEETYTSNISVPNKNLAYYRVQGFICGGMKNSRGDAWLSDDGLTLYMVLKPYSGETADVVPMTLTFSGK